MAILGVDIGISNSRCAVWKDGESISIPNRFGRLLTPSVISLGEKGEILVGQPAQERLLSHPKSTVTGFRQLLGSGEKLFLADREFSPEELCAALLCHLREDGEALLNQRLTKAVLGVPPGWDARRRGALRTACALAGMDAVSLMNKPMAAILAGLKQGEKLNEVDKIVLVFDFGAHVLELSAVDCFGGAFTVLAHCREEQIGSRVFDEAIAERFCRENHIALESLSPERFGLLLRQAEQCKKALSEREALLMLLEGEGLDGIVPISNQELIGLTESVFEKIDRLIWRILEEGALNPGEVQEVILVGGGCRLPLIQEFLTQYFPPGCFITKSPETVVSLGLGAYPEILRQTGGSQSLFLSDINPFTLATGSRNATDPKHPLASPLIERGTSLPATMVRRYHTVYDHQPELVVDVYRGESLYCKENECFGEMRIPLPPAPAEQETVEVRFTYDIDGILEIEATVESTGSIKRHVFTETDTLDDAAVKARLEELQPLKCPPWEREENRLVLTKGEQLYTQTLGDVRAELMDAILWFRAVLELGEGYQIARARKLVTAFFDHVDRQIFS